MHLLEKKEEYVQVLVATRSEYDNGGVRTVSTTMYDLLAEEARLFRMSDGGSTSFFGWKERSAPLNWVLRPFNPSTLDVCPSHLILRLLMPSHWLKGLTN